MYKLREILVKRKWNKTIRELKQKNRYSGGTLREFWYDIKLPDYRFRILPEIYNIIQSQWEPEMVPFVTEILYCKCSTCYRNKLPNLFKLLISDNAIGDYQIQKKYCVGKVQLISLLSNELDIDLINEIDWTDVERAKRVAIKIHTSNRWKDYYEIIVKSIMKKIAIYGAHDDLFKADHWKEAAEKLGVPADLNKEVVQYLIEDAFGYINACDAFQYNPLWIFGSQCYEEILNDIWSWDWKEIERLCIQL